MGVIAKVQALTGVAGGDAIGYGGARDHVIDEVMPIADSEGLAGFRNGAKLLHRKRSILANAN